MNRISKFSSDPWLLPCSQRRKRYRLRKGVNFLSCWFKASNFGIFLFFPEYNRLTNTDGRARSRVTCTVNIPLSLQFMFEHENALALVHSHSCARILVYDEEKNIGRNGNPLFAPMIYHPSLTLFLQNAYVDSQDYGHNSCVVVVTGNCM